MHSKPITKKQSNLYFIFNFKFVLMMSIINFLFVLGQSSKCLNNSKIISNEVINATRQNATTSTKRVNVFEKIYVTRSSKAKKFIKTEVTDIIKGIEPSETSIASKIEASEAHLAEVFNKKLVITKPIKLEIAGFNKEAAVSTNTEEVNVIPHHNKTNIAVGADTDVENIIKLFDENLFITEPNNAMYVEITQEVDITEPTGVINTKGTEPNKKQIVVDVPDKEMYDHTQLDNILMLRIEIPEINISPMLNERLVYDFTMTTQFNKVCCSSLVSHNIKIK